MADPLSITASVVGLITAAAKTSSIMKTVVSTARHAPESCRQIQREIDDIRGVLNQLQKFIDGASTAPSSRTALIMLEHVVAALASCVLTFSELDALVGGLYTDIKISLVDRLRWVVKESDHRAMLVRLEAHKSSLNLILTILTCQKQSDAEAQLGALTDRIQSVLEHHEILVERMRMYEMPSIEGVGLIDSANSPFPVDLGATERITTRIRTSIFAFEEVLKGSRPYLTAAKRYVNRLSLTSSVARTANWSILSGLSLSEVSNIAILALPIYASDLTNSNAYSFTADATDSRRPTVRCRDQSPPSKAEIRGSELPARESQSSLKQGPLFEGQPEEATAINHQRGVFGVALAESLLYAAVDLVYMDGSFKAFLGSMPILIVKVFEFCIDSGKSCPSTTETTLISYRSREEKEARVDSLVEVFDSAAEYGESIDWTGYNADDALSLLARYLEALPDPIIPHTHQEEFFSCLPVGYVEDPNDASTASLTQEEEYKDTFDRHIGTLPRANKLVLLFVLWKMGFIYVFLREVYTYEFRRRHMQSISLALLMGRQQAEGMTAEEVTHARVTMKFLAHNYWYSSHLMDTMQTDYRFPDPTGRRTVNMRDTWRD